MKKITTFFGLASLLLFASCSDDTTTLPVDKGPGEMTYFSTDMGYQSGVAHGSISYTRQTFMNLNAPADSSSATYGTDAWISFNLNPASETYSPIGSDAKWDLAFSYYVTAMDDGEEVTDYGVTGVLVNTNKGIEVASYSYDESDVETDITAAFENFSLEDADALTFESSAEGIGYDWKNFSLTSMLYSVSTNVFYLIKTAEGETYKLRFIGFYGESTSERVIQTQYQRL